ncbi:MAG: DNA polymerase III subunit delta [Candidatus Hydrogenedentota bacterium]
MTASEITQAIQNEPPQPVYLFCPGKSPRARNATFEPILAEQTIEAIVDATVDPANRDFAYAAFYADETPVGSIVMDAQTLPFLADKRVVFVRNAEKYNSETAAGALLDYLAAPNESTVLLFLSNKVDKRTKFYKACDKAGMIVQCPSLNDNEVTQWIRDEVQKQGKSMPGTAIRALMDRTGNHLSDVQNALTLVANYVGQDNDTISPEDVTKACTDVTEEEIWALTDAIATSRSGDALAALRRLTDLGKHPDEMIGTINWLLKSAYAVAIAEGEPNISRFVAQKVRPLTEKLGLLKLRRAFALCTDTQFMMRSTGVDSELALELLVVKLAAPIARRKSA